MNQEFFCRKSDITIDRLERFNLLLDTNICNARTTLMSLREISYKLKDAFVILEKIEEDGYKVSERMKRSIQLFLDEDKNWDKIFKETAEK